MKHILVIGDTHQGSMSAVVPDEPVIHNWMTEEEIDYKPTKDQIKIKRWWDSMLDIAGKVDMCLALGDLCDGTQPKSEGLNQWTTNRKSQAINAMNLLKTIRTNKFRICQGSKYHVCENMSQDHYVADLLKADFKVSFIQSFKKEDIRIHCHHKISTTRSTWQYLTTPLARDMVLLKLNDSVKKYGHVDLTIRAHAHIYVEAGFSSTKGFVTPCWQAPTPYMVMRGLITPPELGFVIVDIEDDGYIHCRPYARPVIHPCGEFKD